MLDSSKLADKKVIGLAPGIRSKSWKNAGVTQRNIPCTLTRLGGNNSIDDELVKSHDELVKSHDELFL